VLEVDGTVEGRRMLDSLLSTPDPQVADDWARGDWVWEVDRQRSGSSRVWFRLLGSPEEYVPPLDPATFSPVSPPPPSSFRRGSPGPSRIKRHQFSFMAR